MRASVFASALRSCVVSGDLPDRRRAIHRTATRFCEFIDAGIVLHESASRDADCLQPFFIRQSCAPRTSDEKWACRNPARRVRAGRYVRASGVPSRQLRPSTLRSVEGTAGRTRAVAMELSPMMGKDCARCGSPFTARATSHSLRTTLSQAAEAEEFRACGHCKNPFQSNNPLRCTALRRAEIPP